MYAKFLLILSASLFMHGSFCSLSELVGGDFDTTSEDSEETHETSTLIHKSLGSRMLSSEIVRNGCPPSPQGTVPPTGSEIDSLVTTTLIEPLASGTEQNSEEVEIFSAVFGANAAQNVLFDRQAVDSNSNSPAKTDVLTLASSDLMDGNLLGTADNGDSGVESLYGNGHQRLSPLHSLLQPYTHERTHTTEATHIDKTQ